MLPSVRLEAERLAVECNMKLYRTSVKEDLNVAVVFQHLAENYVNKVKAEKSGMETFTQPVQIKRTKVTKALQQRKSHF